MKQITTSKGTFILVSTARYHPNAPFDLSDDKRRLVFNYTGSLVTHTTIDLPEGNWQLLGLATNISEDVAKEVVELHRIVEVDSGGKVSSGEVAPSFTRRSTIAIFSALSVRFMLI